MECVTVPMDPIRIEDYELMEKLGEGYRRGMERDVQEIWKSIQGKK